MLVSVFIIIGLIFLIIQTSIFPFFLTGFGRPDLVFLIIIFSALRLDWMRGMIVSLVLGWMTDVLSGLSLGANLFSFSVLYFVVRSFRRAPVEKESQQILIVGASFFVSKMVFYFVFSFFSNMELPDWSWNRLLLDTIVASVAAIPCFLLLNKLIDFVQKREK